MRFIGSAVTFIEWIQYSNTHLFSMQYTRYMYNDDPLWQRGPHTHTHALASDQGHAVK